MPVEVYIGPHDENILGKTLLLRKLARIDYIPTNRLQFIVDNVFTSLADGDYSINGVYFYNRIPEEMVFFLDKRFMLGNQDSCYLYHLYDESFIRLRHNEIYFHMEDLPIEVNLLKIT